MRHPGTSQRLGIPNLASARQISRQSQADHARRQHTHQESSLVNSGRLPQESAGRVVIHLARARIGWLDMLSRFTQTEVVRANNMAGVAMSALGHKRNPVMPTRCLLDSE
jgi:uncharacterized membrane protein